jgi:hypothetical protein
LQNEISQIINEARALDTEWMNVAGSGGPELRQVRNVASLNERSHIAPLLADLLAALPGPEGQVAEALVGRLGDPATFDDADKEVLTATPRRERRYVRLHAFESVYTNQIDRLTDPADGDRFFTNAASILSGGSLAPLTPGEDAGLGATDEATSSGGRGYVIRLVLTTPVPVTGPNNAYDVFDLNGPLDLSRMLYEISPSAERPNLPYKVEQGGVLNIDSVANSQDILIELRRQYDARVASEAGATDEPADGDPAGRGVGRGSGGRGEAGGGLRRFGQGGLGGRTFGQRPSGGNTPRPADPEGEALKDPITGESMANDSRLELLLAVRLDPPPFASPEAVPEGEEAGLASAD